MSEPQPIARTNSGSIIVFDPVRQKLSIRKQGKLDGKHVAMNQIMDALLTVGLARKATSRISAPKWSNRLDIYLDREDTDTKSLAATLNLDKLGWTTSLKRFCGSIREVWVMELPDGDASPTIAAAA